jgi:hypothetical protein
MARVGETVDAAKHGTYGAQPSAASHQEHHQDLVFDWPPSLTFQKAVARLLGRSSVAQGLICGYHAQMPGEAPVSRVGQRLRTCDVYFTFVFSSDAMIIRRKQIEELESAILPEYRDRLIAFYRDRAPWFIGRFSDAQLEQRVAHAISRARAFGLSSAEGTMQYVGLALAAGPNFDEDPRVDKFMTRPGSPPEVKLQRLLQLVVRDLHQFGEGTGENG